MQSGDADTYRRRRRTCVCYVVSWGQREAAVYSIVMIQGASIVADPSDQQCF